MKFLFNNVLCAKVISTALLCTSLAAPINAAGAKKPVAENPGSGGGSNPGTVTPPTNGNGSQIIDLALTLAIVYAKNDPRYAVVLNTLGINSAQDLRNLLKGNSDGSNITAIVSRLAFLEAQKKPEIAAMLAKLGVTDEASLRALLKDPGSQANIEVILGLALAQAKSNPKYGKWLEKFNIDDVQDLKVLFNTRGKSGNLQSLILFVAMKYVESNPKYAQYAPMIEAAMAMLGLTSGSDGSGDPNTPDDDIIDIGPFSSMTVGEVKAIRKIK